MFMEPYIVVLPDIKPVETPRSMEQVRVNRVISPPGRRVVPPALSQGQSMV